MHEKAAQLGLSAWKAEVVMVGEESRTVTTYFIGFKEVDLPIAEAESWDDAWDQALRVIFSA